MRVKHHQFQSIGSTQEYARNLLDADEPVPFLVTTAEQTAGRGRMGRTWISPPGNFYGSFVIKATMLHAQYGEYSFLTAVALLHTARQFSDDNFTLKWPNDILLNGRKCAGILIESYGVENEYLIIGIGVNLRHAPPDDAVQTPAAALWPDAKPDLTRDAEFASALVENFTTWHERYAEQGFETIRSEWLRHAHALNQQITVKTPKETLAGIFAGIDASGNLLLTQGAETRKITTADVALS